MNYEFKYITHKGKVRKTNEDFLYAMNDIENNCGFFIVADGMGGHDYGAYSSKKICNDLALWWNDNKLILIGYSYEEIFSELRRVINKFNKEIREFSINNNISTGTTLSCLMIIGGYYYSAHVGDSRIYMHYKNKLSQITQDDSKAFQDYSNGVLNIKKYKEEKNSKLIKCIGLLDVVFPQFYYGEVTEEVLFMLFSDGFYQYFSEKKLNKYSKKAKFNLEKTIKKMGDYVLLKGANDNFTGLMIKGVIDG